MNGSAFLPNESTGLYWDQPNKIAGASNADASGNFTTKVKPFATDAPYYQAFAKLCGAHPEVLRYEGALSDRAGEPVVPVGGSFVGGTL